MIAGTESCHVRHVGVAESGALHIAHDDGTEAEVGPGQSYVIEPGHDAWVVGDEPFVAYEFESKAAEEYARGGGWVTGHSPPRRALSSVKRDSRL